MKPYLNERNKKWVLTFSLLVALGFNISHFGQATGTAGFASTAKDKVNDHDVKYTSQDDKTTIAVVSGIDQEGGLCDSCQAAFVLNVPLKDATKDLSKLDIALLKQLPKADADKEDGEDTPVQQTAAEAADEAKQKKHDAKVDDDAKILQRLKKTCHIDDGTSSASDDDAHGWDMDHHTTAASSSYSAEANARCLVNGYVAKLQDKVLKIDKGVAEQFLQTDIENVLMGLVNSSMPSNTLFGSTSPRQATATNLTVADLLRRIAAGVPPHYNDIRTEARSLADMAVKAYAQKAVDEKRQAESYRQDSIRYQNAANQMKNNPQMQQLFMNKAYQLDAAYEQTRTDANATYEVLTTSAIPDLMGGLQSGLQVAVDSQWMPKIDAQGILQGFQMDTSNMLGQMSNTGLTTFGTPNVMSTGALQVVQQQQLGNGTMILSTQQPNVLNSQLVPGLTSQQFMPATSATFMPSTQATILQAAPSQQVSLRAGTNNLPAVRQFNQNLTPVN